MSQFLKKIQPIPQTSYFLDISKQVQICFDILDTDLNNLGSKNKKNAKFTIYICFLMWKEERNYITTDQTKTIKRILNVGLNFKRLKLKLDNPFHPKVAFHI